MEVPEEQDGLSAPPKWYKHYLDAYNKDPLEWIKKVITTNFPAIRDIQVFHEIDSNTWGKMVVRFTYNRTVIDLPISYQEILNTLTDKSLEKLASRMQKMAPMERWIFNIILLHVDGLEKKSRSTRYAIKVALEYEKQLIADEQLLA